MSVIEGGRGSFEGGEVCDRDPLDPRVLNRREVLLGVKEPG